MPFYKFMHRDLAAETKYLLKQYNMSAGRTAGQNFLIDDKVLQDIIAAADIQPSDFVLEVGAGLGILTTQLAKRAKRVLAVEYDERCFPALQKLSSLHDNLIIIHDDILRLANKELARHLSGDDYRVIANIPYQITAKLIYKFIQDVPPAQDLVLLVQQEVAERITAEPGQMSLLALSVQFYAQVEIIRQVDKHCFWPVPAVDSALIHIIRQPQKMIERERRNIDEKRLWQILRSGFSSKRKTLANNLANSLHLTRTEIEENLNRVGLSKNCRAQELSLQQWLDLVDILPAGQAYPAGRI
ncbi:MAG: 16S rRNA (adenine(1518)-N(6)/adenine(1519)-N(6))-dimethyltransferase RsmA [Candidatus Komeilibacteria bacterium]